MGPSDLSLLMESFGEADKRLRDRIDSVLERAADAGIPVGTIAVGEEEIERYSSTKFGFLVVGYDTHFLIEGSQRALGTYKSVGSR